MIELDCGIHEATRAIDPCPACTRARAANAKELRAFNVDRYGFTPAERDAALDRWEAGERPSDLAVELGTDRRALDAWKHARKDRRSHAEAKAARLGEPRPERNDPTPQEEQVEMSGSTSRFTEEEQRAAVLRVRDGDETVAAVAKSLGVGPSILGVWRRKHFGLAAPQSPSEKAAKAERVDALLGDARRERPARQPRERAVPATPPVAATSVDETSPMPREVAPLAADVVDVIEDLGVSYAVGRVIEALVAGDLDRAAVALERARARRAA